MTRTRVSVPDEQLATDLADLVDVDVWDLVGPAPAPAYDLVVQPYMSDPALLRALATVPTSVVQSQSIGYDGVSSHLPGSIVFCNAVGVHEASTAELAVGLVLASLGGLDRFARAQVEGRWTHGRREALADKRVLLVGFGGVGRQIASRLQPFDVELFAVASSARYDGDVQVRSHDELPALLPDADVVVLALPLDQRTKGMVDEAFLQRMKRGALLVNVARGALVHTDALLEAVAEGRVGAALDVVDPEPLPHEHPLWRAEGVLVTPHVGGHSSAMRPRLVRLLRDQVERLRSGRPLLNVVLEPRQR